MTSVFFDSNVLVYLVDNRDERKQGIVKRIVTSALTRRLDGWVSVQTMAEFINVSLKKLNLPSVQMMQTVRQMAIEP